MNRNERAMVELLERGRERHGWVGVKAEFEAEGTRTDELLRLLDVGRSAGLGLTLKIGGCEAVRDLLEARQFGVRWVVAPMVETPYALSKYVGAVGRVFGDEVDGETGFLFNVETDDAFLNRTEMCRVAAAGGLDGVVFGRVDFAASQGRGRAELDGRAVTEQVVEVARACASWDLDLVVGGGITLAALGPLQQVARTRLTRFETRKIVFDAPTALFRADAEQALLDAVHFELLWLLNKQAHYGRLSQEDAARIAMLQVRVPAQPTGSPSAFAVDQV